MNATRGADAGFKVTRHRCSNHERQRHGVRGAHCTLSLNPVRRFIVVIRKIVCNLNIPKGQIHSTALGLLKCKRTFVIHNFNERAEQRPIVKEDNVIRTLLHLIILSEACFTYFSEGFYDF